MAVGVIIARLQPIHKGHLELVRQALNENDEVLILVGSADKLNKRNPIPIAMRLDLAKKAISEEFGDDANKIKVMPLNDLTDESDNSHDWGFYLYSKIVTECKNPCFTIYYSDGFEIITTWFPPFILRNNVSLCLLARGAIVDGISATTVRKLIEEDSDALEVYVPKCVCDRRETIKRHIELSKLIK